jgi:hypothetical protein
MPTFLFDSIHNPTTMFEVLLRTKYYGSSKELLVFPRRRIMILKHWLFRELVGSASRKLDGVE